ncbi:hypothetical protein CNE_1c11800 [Cupriavidus necator N-1]|uniref:Uncharacterized protein n=1 Tax=Cupriavidus necator (strain ATCC 43291 / DSM 13513 / CCUG 52238 / LMG 8453 / N-1) TaxID=1042878 RepID=G0ER17_CUPNN|nr:hypothetical protein [Cupriavidus necator]AEI76535.1 hypothetical protein CNE_1c11800 [Cupriavidus necator N-1]MDX6011345.1 hypothetical protein [Cupriavidus necator]
MIRSDLLPGTRSVAPVGRVRPKLILRRRKPLTARELKSVFDRVKKRVLKGGEPFGLFAIKHGQGRVFRLISVKDANYTAQLRVDKALQHMVGTYDGSANLGHVWDDLCAFDRTPPA